MRGHIAKKGNRWYPVVSVYDEGGERKRQWHSGHDKKREAAAALTRILSTLADGTYVEPSKLTTADYLQREWLPAIRATVRESTYLSYKEQVDCYIVPRIGGVPLQKLTAQRLNTFYAELLASGRRQRKGGLSPQSVRYVHAIIRKALADAVRWTRLPRNVADAADPPKKTRRAHTTWAPEQLRAFLEHLRADRLYALWLLLAMTGMRRGEAVGLRWSDVDLEARRLSVAQTIVAPGYRVSKSTPKTDRGRRRVALDTGTVAALRAHREQQALEVSFIGAGYADEDLVFAALEGTPLNPHAITEAFDRHVKNAGLPRIRLHDLRHTHATLALRTGVHPKVVSDRLGHASVAFTLDTYSDSVPVLEETAAELVAALITGGAAAETEAEVEAR